MALDWERPFLGPLYAWSSAIQGKTGARLPVMLRVLMSWLADRLENGDWLQRPDVGVEGDTPFSFYTNAKAENGKAWIAGSLVLARSDTRLGPLGLHQGRYQEGDCVARAPGHSMDTRE